MFKNVASQSIALFAFDITTGAAKTGDAANMVFYITKDWGSVTAIAANSGVPTEMDSTNAKGWYKIAVSQTETNADEIVLSGKSSTANISVVGRELSTFVGQTGDSFARLGAPAGASVSADIAEIEGETDTILTNTTGITFTVANQVDVNVVDWKGSAAPAMTGDAFARLGAPVGASISADIAAIPITKPGIRKNVALAKFEFLMTDSTNHNPSTGLAVTVTRSIDGGAFAAGTLSAVTEISNGIYSVDFASGDLNGTVITLRCTAAASDDLFVTIHTDP